MPVMPSDTPSSPSDYAAVTPHGIGTAPYDVQAPQADLSATFNAANALTGAGILYPQGPRQSATDALMHSPQGYAEFNITAGFHGGGGDNGWPADVSP